MTPPYLGQISLENFPFASQRPIECRGDWDHNVAHEIVRTLNSHALCIRRRHGDLLIDQNQFSCCCSTQIFQSASRIFYYLRNLLKKYWSFFGFLIFSFNLKQLLYLIFCISRQMTDVRSLLVSASSTFSRLHLAKI